MATLSLDETDGQTIKDSLANLLRILAQEAQHAENPFTKALKKICGDGGIMSTPYIIADSSRLQGRPATKSEVRELLEQEEAETRKLFEQERRKIQAEFERHHDATMGLMRKLSTKVEELSCSMSRLNLVALRDSEIDADLYEAKAAAYTTAAARKRMVSGSAGSAADGLQLSVERPCSTDSGSWSPQSLEGPPLLVTDGHESDDSGYVERAGPAEAPSKRARFNSALSDVMCESSEWSEFVLEKQDQINALL